jgi:uncharacterized protein YbaR (Trm112 family)
VIDAEFLKMLACPFCVTRPVKNQRTLASSDLVPVPSLEQLKFLKCADCGRSYPVDEQGVPHLLIDAAVLPQA